MLLLGVKEENGWLSSGWSLTYRVGWDSILKAVYAVYDFYSDRAILLDGEKTAIEIPEELLSLPESGSLTIRGVSDIIGAPIMITFYNQSQTVEAAVAEATEEFQTADYEKFNLSLGQYMDSMELAMYR